MRVLGVVGPGDASGAQASAARSVGRLLGSRGCAVVTGGLGGVMAAASEGAASAGAVVVGLLPGFDRADANEWVSVAIPTGMGELRNGLIVRAADGLIALGGGFGTLSEVALALRAGKPVVGLDFAFAVEGVVEASSPEHAVSALFDALS